MNALTNPPQPSVVDTKLSACRRIFASDWPGEVGRQMVLRGDMDDEPEMLRLMAAFEEGARMRPLDPQQHHGKGE